jgi:hypothetical protein
MEGLTPNPAFSDDSKLVQIEAGHLRTLVNFARLRGTGTEADAVAIHYMGVLPRERRADFPPDFDER